MTAILTSLPEIPWFQRNAYLVYNFTSISCYASMHLELSLSAVGSVPCDDSPQMKQLELQCFGEGDSATISGVNFSVRQISETIKSNYRSWHTFEGVSQLVRLRCRRCSRFMIPVSTVEMLWARRPIYFQSSLDVRRII